MEKKIIHCNNNNWKNKKEEIKALVSFGKELQKKNILYILYREL